MSSEFEGCLYIAVDETEIRDVTSIPGVVVGAIIGLIVGGIVGLIFYKFCCHRKGCLGKSGAIASEEPKHQVPVQPFAGVTYENSVAKYDRDRIDAKPDLAPEDKDGYTDQYQLAFSDFLADLTWEGMILKNGKHRLGDLIMLELTQWEERKTCMLQQFRSILNDVLAHNMISETQYHDIITCEEKALSAAYEQLKEKCNIYRKKCLKSDQPSLLDLFGSFQEMYSTAIQSVISEYRGRLHHFSRLVSKLSAQVEVEKRYHSLLLHHADMVEGYYRNQQEEVMESTKSFYKRVGLIIQNLNVFLITEYEISKVLTSIYESSLQKMQKTGRISSRTVQEVKESIQCDFSINKDDINNAFSDISTNLENAYVSNMVILEQQCDNEINSILHAYEDQVSSDGFVQSYLTACTKKKMQMNEVSKDFADHAFTEIFTNITKLSQDQKKRRAESIQEFCQHLKETDTLSGTEVEQLEQDLVKRLEATQAKLSNTCRRNITEIWRQFDDRMTTHFQEESQVDASILQDSVTDNLLSLESFLRLQIDLSDFDWQSIMHERESITLLIVNEINSFRTQFLHVIENGMSSSLAKLLKKVSHDLVNETVAEIIGVLDYLWDEHSSMGNFRQEIVSVSCINFIMDVYQDEMSQILAKKLVLNVMGEEISADNEKMLVEEIEKNLTYEISTKDNLTQLASITQHHNENLSRGIADLMARYSLALSMAEEKVRAVQTKRLGRLNVKAQRISQSTPPVGSRPTDLQPFLEHTLLQQQVDRALECVESESVQEILLERLRLDRNIRDEVLDMSSDSTAHLHATFCKHAGLSKTDFSTCISQIKMSIPVSPAQQKAVVQRYHSHWKNASHLRKITN